MIAVAMLEKLGIQYLGDENKCWEFLSDAARLAWFVYDSIVISAI